MADLNVEIAASLGRFEREMAKVESRLTKLANGIEKKAGAQLAKVDTSSARTAANLNKMVGEMGKAETGARRYGSSLQQVGFQVGDFATQVGAGTSATQALGQQLPQLLGAFGTFGALAGAAAAIMIPLGSALIKTAFDSETLDDRMKGLEKSTDAMTEAAKMAAAPISELRAKHGDLADEIQRSSQAMLAFTAAQAGAQLLGAASAAASLFPDAAVQPRVYGMSDTEWAEVQEAQARKLMKATGATRKQVDELAMALRRLESANGPEAVVRDSENLLRIMSRLPDAASNLGPQITAINGLMQQAQQQIEAQQLSVTRLREEYGKTTAELERLADDRKLAEAELAKAVAAGNVEQANAAQGYIDKIDEAIEKTKSLALESDTAFQMISGRLVEMAKSFPDLSLQLPGGAPFAREMATAATEIEAANKGLRELIKLKESGGDYNVTLDNGAYTGGARDLVNMTINEVLEMQRQMLAHPDNKKNSSAAGAYQIVRKTLQSLVDELGLTGNELYSLEMQDRLADQLIRRRRGQGNAGLRNEWEGLNGVADSTLDKARGAQSIGLVDPEVEKRQKDAASERQRQLDKEVAARKRAAEEVKKYGEQLAANLLTEQQTAAIEKQRADQIAAINAGTGTDAEKAAAIAAVNAAMEKQITIMALTEEAKRRQVDLDTLMVGSTMTYRQAIEALGDAASQKVIADQAMQASAQSLAEAQAFASQQMQSLQDGFLDAIIAGESFSDVLKNVAANMAKAWAQAALFGNGPLGSQGGGGLLSGLFQKGGFLSQVFGGFRADGGPISGGRAYVVGERGPEIIVPRSAGNVIPNHALGRSGGGMNVTIDLRGTTGDKALDEKLRAGAARTLAQAERMAPGWIANNNKRTG